MDSISSEFSVKLGYEVQFQIPANKIESAGY